MKSYRNLLSALLMLGGICCPGAESSATSAIMIPVQGNAYDTTGYSGNGNNQAVDIVGSVTGWTDPSTVISLYFKTPSTGKLKVSLRATAGQEEAATSVIRVTIDGKSRKVSLKGGDVKEYDCGTFNIKTPGYVKIDLQGEKKTGEKFADVDGILISGPAANGDLHFSTVERIADAYWARRGPSVHMNYRLPADSIEYFYNEVTVPQGYDVNGTYYMLTGFGEGYMGIQAISDQGKNRNRVLFSVWSPYSTDNPNEIPDSLHVNVLATGPGVTAKNFGNEGSGKQSFMDYPWQTGKTYKTLVRVRPDGKGNTVYTGYFCDENGTWHLLSSLSRPKTETWYTHAHSFLECFNPAFSYMPRRVEFGNQWVCDNRGEWHEVTEAKFSCDNTGRAGTRMDYNGGLNENTFYLQNCGFVNVTTPYGSTFHRQQTGKKPEIDLSALEKLAL